MTPAMQNYLRKKAIEHRAPNANTMEFTDEMKSWKSADWEAYAEAQYRERWAHLKSTAAAEERMRRIELYQQILGDIGMATNLADGGIKYFHQVSGDLSLKQFTELGYAMFSSVAVC